MSAHAVVVLGAPPVAAGVAGPALSRRLAHGVDVLERRGLPFLVVSGGEVGPPPAEARLMQALAIELGVAAARIVVEDRSRNTFENAVYTGRIMRDRGWPRVVVVTDAWHMRRALFVFARLGLDAIGEPVPEPAETPLAERVWMRCREFQRSACSAYLFRVGRHKPFVDTVWGR